MEEPDGVFELVLKVLMSEESLSEETHAMLNAEKSTVEFFRQSERVVFCEIYPARRSVGVMVKRVA